MLTDGLKATPERHFIPLGIAVLTISDSRDAAQDRSGDLLAGRVQAAGHRLHERRLVPDEPSQVREIISSWCAHRQVQAVLSTGGTGLTGRDTTPEAVQQLFDRHIPGFGELFRSLSYDQVGASTIQSRALAGISNTRFIFCLPGSPKACVLAWDQIIQPQLDARTRPCNLVELIPRLRE